MSDTVGYDDLIKPPVRKMAFTNMFDLAKERKEPDWLITDIAECGTHAMLFGDPEAGKSLVLFDLLCSVATGRKWRGREVKQGPVFYLCGEGAAGLGRRTAAWMKLNNIEPDMSAPFYTSDVPAALSDEDNAKMIAEVIAEMCVKYQCSPAAIGIDTLARNFGPGNENSAEDVGRFVANIDHHLIGDLGATVFTCHHTGHADKERARGSMSLPAAVDVSYRISKTPNENMPDIVQMECKKSKDFAKPDWMIFELQVVDLGYTDSQGRPVRGAALQSVRTEKFQSGRPNLDNKNDIMVFDLFVDKYQAAKAYLVREGRNNEDVVMDVEYLRKEAIKRSAPAGHGPGSDKYNAAKRRVNRAIQRLFDERHLQYRPNGQDIFPTYLG
jgi:hypothetical protein